MICNAIVYTHTHIDFRFCSFYLFYVQWWVYEYWVWNTGVESHKFVHEKLNWKTHSDLFLDYTHRNLLQAMMLDNNELYNNISNNKYVYSRSYDSGVFMSRLKRNNNDNKTEVCAMK